MSKKLTSRQKEYFKLVEKEIYNYHYTKREIKEQRMAIIEGGGKPETSVQSAPGDPTGSKATRLVTSSTLMHMEKVVGAIEDALKELEFEPVRKEMIRLKYWDRRLKDYGIMQELNIPKNTFYSWRRKFVYSIASKLGWDAGQEG